MKELLANEAVQTALVVVIVTGLNALVNWLKQKFPTQKALVEANWCYLQPAVEGAIAAARAAKVQPEWAGTISGIVMRSMTEFADSYRKLEGKDATDAEIKAARAEITSAVERVTGG